MANAKKCDRCGKYYDNNETYINGWRTTGLETISNSSGGFGGRYDLCDDCLKEFIEVFMKGEKDD